MTAEDGKVATADGRPTFTADMFLADPPPVHANGSTVWKAEADLYDLLARQVGPESRTLETGLGISTALFAAWGCEHTCVVYRQEEVDVLRSYLARKGVDDSRVRYEVGGSDQVLPRLDPTPLDLVLIDGGHAWPLPIIDWFYGAGRLVANGLLVLDDTWLESVSLGLTSFLTRDERWARVERRMRWQAYRRLDGHPLAEEHVAQSFLTRSLPSRVSAKMPPEVRHVAAKAARRLKLL